MLKLNVKSLALCLLSVVFFIRGYAQNIIPKPLKVVNGKGFFTLNPKTVISTDEGAEFLLVASYLNDIVKKELGKPLVVSKANSKTTGQFILLTSKDAKKELGPEGYEIDVTTNAIIIRANQPIGIFYGVQSLRQMLMTGKTPGTKSVLNSSIQDSPRFVWRGMHLDVSRHFFDKEFVKKYIDLLALHKLNVFHWHLTDDQGWRIEVKKYPKLTSVGAWREDRRDQNWNMMGEQRRALPPTDKIYGGFYTQEDIKEVVKYAQDRFITVLPEIEMPAHSSAALAAYPQYSCTGGPFTVPSLLNIDEGIYGLNGAFCAGNDSTYIFIQNILEEVMPLFPNQYVHIGGDEVEKTRWKACPKCQKRIKEEGLKDEHELQSYFIKRIEKYLISKNKKMVGWDEILEGGLAPEATVMSWRGIKGGIEAAKQKHDVIMAASTHLYFDKPQSALELMKWNDHLSIEEVYAFDPIPAELTAEEGKHILGAQGQVWTELIQTPARVEYMAIPRIAALAELVWTEKEQKNYKDFDSRLNVFLTQLDKGGYNYFVPMPIGPNGPVVFTDKAKMILTKPVPNSEIRYTIDGTEPTKKSSLYSAPFDVEKNVVVKSKTFLPNGKSSVVTEAVYRKEAPRTAVVMKEAKPGISYKYFEGDFKSVTELDTAKPLKSGTVDKMEIPKEHPADHFGLDFNGYINIPTAGVYTFYLNSDDGSDLFIGKERVIEFDGLHAPAERKNQIALSKGLHPIKVRYFEGTYGEKFVVQFEGPGIEKQDLKGLMH